MSNRNAPPASTAPIPTARSTALVAAAQAGTLDPDIIHAMELRDNQLVRDEALHGPTSGVFVYQFKIAGNEVQGISVIGARHLAAMYGGIRHRMIASIDKFGAIHKSISYANGGNPMAVSVAVLRELEDEPDYYTSTVEIEDIKTGNTVQAERTELRFERRQDGSPYERPNYRTIAQSKAYRNAVLAIIPQDILAEFKKRAIAQGKSKDMTEDALDEKRRVVIRFAAAKGVPIQRQVIEGLTWDQIGGLGEAARVGVDSFREALANLTIAEPQQAAEPKAIEQRPEAPIPQAGVAQQAQPMPAATTSKMKPAHKRAMAAQAPLQTMEPVAATQAMPQDQGGHFPEDDGLNVPAEFDRELNPRRPASEAAAARPAAQRPSAADDDEVDAIFGKR